MREFNGHLYKWSKPFGSVNHHWELRSAHGGVHFHVTLSEKYAACAGLELHSVYPRGTDAPDHIDCPVTGGRCWHDGTSLYATETLWPMVETYLKGGNHEAIFRMLEEEARKLEEYAPKPASFQSSKALAEKVGEV
jgi:hypothetical protein